MNREIKFRAWHSTFKQMIALGPSVVGVQEPGLFLPFQKNIKLMQFTGLKDKNGVEIYEGDVIRLDAADEDEYRNGSPYVMFEKGCFAYRYSHWSDDLCIVLYQTANQMLVVGNVYENPELLEKESDDPPHDGKTSDG